MKRWKKLSFRMRAAWACGGSFATYLVLTKLDVAMDLASFVVATAATIASFHWLEGLKRFQKRKRPTRK